MFEKSRKSIAAVTRGGTYRVRDSSLGPASSTSLSKRNHKSRPKYLSVTVVFLDDSQHTFEFEKSAKGSVLLERVFQHLELLERDYFGIQFDELLPPPDVPRLSSPHLRWLESAKPLKKQLHFTKTPPSNNGSPTSPRPSTRKGLSSALTEKKSSSYISTATVFFRVKFFVEDPSRLMEEYTRYHMFLQIRKDILEGRLLVTASSACLFASYAAQSEIGDFSPEEHDDNGYYLRHLSNYTYIEPLVTNEPECLRKIAQLHKLHKGQTPADAEYNYLDHAKRLDTYGVNFHCVKDSTGKEILLGISAIGLSVYHNNIKINTFSWSKITKIAFKRKHFFIQLRRELSEEYDTLLMFDCHGYRSCKTLWKSCVEFHTFFRCASSSPPENKRAAFLLLTFGSRFRYSGRTEYQTREDASTRGKSRDGERRTFFRSPSKKLLLMRQTLRLQQKSSPDSETAKENESTTDHRVKEAQCQSATRNGNIVLKSANLVNTKGHNTAIRAYDKVQSKSDKEPKMAWAEQILSDDDGGFIQRPGVPLVPLSTQHITLNTIGIAFADEDENSQSDDGAVSIRLEPDVHGKFGFNVKGGFDMSCPVLVSRVAPGTPADTCYPRLNEGDQLIQINGRETYNLPHREVVNTIRHAATVNRELLLRVRQNVYTIEDYDEPVFQYTPDVPLLHLPSDGENRSPLAASMFLLAEAIESDSISSQFELIFRKKPGLACDIAKLPENNAKNRYRDISPYDSTRVILKNSPTGDYINASYVNIEIPASGIVNRYIACQGPLSFTCVDFWIMVWETQSPLIVMLTPICERGRVKCHPYWPEQVNSFTIYHNIKVTTSEEVNMPNWVQRKFYLTHVQTQEERLVIQLQFQSWPDHGIPQNSSAFIKFIQEVRKVRAGSDIEPTIVHCSAGIGRTGVAILMETAECLIEANQPVFPLDIVSQMRIQRPLMIQTSSQYRFVCQCVLNVFQQGIVRPLPEYSVLTRSPPVKSMLGSNPLLSWS